MDANQPIIPVEEQFKIMADSAPVLIWVSGTDKLCYFFNAGWLRFTGRTMEQEYGNGWTQGVHPDDLQRCMDIYSSSFDSRKEFKIEYRLRRHDGIYRWLVDTGIPRYDINGEFAGYIGSCIDIDEILTAERLVSKNITDQALRDEQELNEELASANEELAASNEELSATNEQLMQTQESLSSLNNQLEDIVNFRTKELLASQQRLHSMVMTTPIGMTVLRGKDLIIEIANQHILDIWNRPAEEVINMELISAFPELIGQPFPKLLQDVFTTGKAISMPEIEVNIVSPDGNKHLYVEFSYDPLFDTEGKVEAILATVTDVTEVVEARKRLERSEQDQQALNEELSAINEELAAANEELIASQDSLHLNMEQLAESEARFRSLISQAPVGICIIRAKDLMIQEVNDAYLELVGRKRSDMENRTIWQAVPEAADNYAPIMNEVISSGMPFNAKEHELVLIRKGAPEIVFVDFVYEPVKDADEKVTTIMVLAIEISDKVIARRNIADVEERIRLAVEAAEIGTFDHDLLTDEMVTSDRFDMIFGFDHPVPRKDILSAIHPDDREYVRQTRESGYISGKILYDTRLIHKDGSIHWIRVYGKVYHDAEHTPLRVLGTILDITEFKSLQQQKDDFISIASHELKTPITSLKASLQLLERFKDRPDAPLIPKLIEQSSKSMVKISELVEDLLNVSRMSEGQIQLNKSSFNIADLLKNCCSHVRAAGKHDLIFEGDLHLNVFADEQRIDQVVVNFVNNAVKYAPDSKDIYLIVRKMKNIVWIGVKDNGPGVPPGKLPHLFDRYYRADSSGFQVSGLGLGLYISAEIIKRHEGEIGVESELGKGSTFWFTIPLEIKTN
ncbi:hypothetical protein DBR11_19255 [Pedobacter sp. HMWF019]|uniref:PAS domain S-box protein n=1 Tax=Pedobacter sp. HMWF019 TaxID=2056856 RepID=UPI000D3C7F11|nr:PAS domain S-box protein [Pedobacter sp. HMWF019]PTS96361.1 hypothetical protein DBR11_19255 [Pedobacter sp. HMWF019]